MRLMLLRYYGGGRINPGEAPARMLTTHSLFLFVCVHSSLGIVASRREYDGGLQGRKEQAPTHERSCLGNEAFDSEPSLTGEPKIVLWNE